jgi:hypothetical protein
MPARERMKRWARYFGRVSELFCEILMQNALTNLPPQEMSFFFRFTFPAETQTNGREQAVKAQALGKTHAMRLGLNLMVRRWRHAH